MPLNKTQTTFEHEKNKNTPEKMRFQRTLVFLRKVNMIEVKYHI